MRSSFDCSPHHFGLRVSVMIFLPVSMPALSITYGPLATGMPPAGAQPLVM